MPIEDNCQSANKRIIAHISTENQNYRHRGATPTLDRARPFTSRCRLRLLPARRPNVVPSPTLAMYDPPFALLPVRKPVGLPSDAALDSGAQLRRSRTWMPANVFGRVLNRVVHQFVSGVFVVEVRPGAQLGVRPCCISGLQDLIRSRVPGRAGPTPRQHLPSATIWRHSRASARRGK